MILFFTLLAAINCKQSQTGVVDVFNHSGQAIDSIHFSINNYNFIFFGIETGGKASRTFTKDSAASKRDVWYSCKGFVKDSIVFNQFFSSNDMGHIPDSFRVRILPGFKLEQF
jgi:hypothetical protein